MSIFKVLFVCVILWNVGCSAPATDTASNAATDHGEATALKDAITLYASFDTGFTADYAAGDPTLYTAANWQSSDAREPVAVDDPSVSHMASGGHVGGALRFHSDWDPVVFFMAEDHLQAGEDAWSGAFSFWLKVIPDEELEEGYSDPFIVTDKNWDNASFYVDFTEEDRPRKFRFAAFSDKNLWNPDGLGWDEVPVSMRPMISVESAPFAGGAWTHVVLSFEGINSDAPGLMTGYINGEEVGRLDNKSLQLTWNLEETLMALGRHYTGAFDELVVFNRSITADEVRMLFERPVKEWY